jgi:hypothetical protein
MNTFQVADETWIDHRRYGNKNAYEYGTPEIGLYPAPFEGHPVCGEMKVLEVTRKIEGNRISRKSKC